MAAHMNSTLASLELETSVCGILFTITDATNAILLIALIPLLDLLIVPLLRDANPSILKRLGIGSILAFLSLLTLLLMEAFGKHSQGREVCMFRTEDTEHGQLEINVYWIFLPLVLVTLAEILIYIPCEHT